MWLNHVARAARPILRPYWQLGLESCTDSTPGSGPLIVVANHQSFLDAWFLSIPFPGPSWRETPHPLPRVVSFRTLSEPRHE